MNRKNFQVRRATLDDLAGIRKLWQQADLSGKDLEKRFTEFQVVETPEGELLGCIGLQLEGLQGHIHSEGFRSPELEPDLRMRLWERIQSVARNHGLVRLWTREESPFWVLQGFQAPEDGASARRPGLFGAEDTGWTTLRLKEEPPNLAALDQEFELFKQSQRELSARAMKQAAVLRVAAGVLAVIGLGLAVFASLYVLRHLPQVLKP